MNNSTTFSEEEASQVQAELDKRVEAIVNVLGFGMLLTGDYYTKDDVLIGEPTSWPTDHVECMKVLAGLIHTLEGKMLSLMVHFELGALTFIIANTKADELKKFTYISTGSALKDCLFEGLSDICLWLEELKVDPLPGEDLPSYPANSSSNQVYEKRQRLLKKYNLTNADSNYFTVTLWNLYGNNGLKHTPGGHYYIQGLVEHGCLLWAEYGKKLHPDLIKHLQERYPQLVGVTDYNMVYQNDEYI